MASISHLKQDEYHIKDLVAIHEADWKTINANKGTESYAC